MIGGIYNISSVHFNSILGPFFRFAGCKQQLAAELLFFPRSVKCCIFLPNSTYAFYFHILVYICLWLLSTWNSIPKYTVKLKNC